MGYRAPMAPETIGLEILALFRTLCAALRTYLSYIAPEPPMYLKPLPALNMGLPKIKLTKIKSTAERRDVISRWGTEIRKSLVFEQREGRHRQAREGTCVRYCETFIRGKGNCVPGIRCLQNLTVFVVVLVKLTFSNVDIVDY